MQNKGKHCQIRLTHILTHSRKNIAHHRNLHTQFEQDTADPVLGQCDLAADDRFQRRSQHPTTFLHVNHGNVSCNDDYLIDLGKLLREDLQEKVDVCAHRVISRNANDLGVL